MNPFAEMVRNAGLIPQAELEAAAVCRWCRQRFEAHAEEEEGAVTGVFCRGLRSEFWEASAKRPLICTKCRREMMTNYGICDECRARESTSHMAQLLADARGSIPEKFRGVKLDSPSLLQRMKASPAVLSAARAAIDGRKAIVLITGPTGSGKTSLATGMLSTVIEAAILPKSTPIALDRARRARYLDALSLSLARQEHRLGNAQPPSVRQAMDASLLVIDEFGRDPKTTFDVPKVIHDREASMRLTIVCTWLDQAGIGQAYDGGVARRLFDKAIHIELGA